MGRASSEAWKFLRNTRTALFRLNFYRLHLLYFILVIVVSSVILYGSNTAGFSLAYIDAIFLCTSAMCSIGLSTVNLSSLTGFQQSVLFVLMLLGDLTIVTISVVIVRRYHFGKKIRGFLEGSGAGRQIAQEIEDRRQAGKDHPERQDDGRPEPSSERSRRSPSEMSRADRTQSHLSGYGSYPTPWNLGHVESLVRLLTRRKTSDFAGEHHYLSFRPMLDRKVV